MKREYPIENVDERETIAKFDYFCRKVYIMDDGTLVFPWLGMWREIIEVHFWRMCEEKYKIAVVFIRGGGVRDMFFSELYATSEYSRMRKDLKRYYEVDFPALRIGVAHTLKFTE